MKITMVITVVMIALLLMQALSEKNVCMCYELHAQSGSACTAGVLLQSSSYIILHSRCEQHT